MNLSRTVTVPTQVLARDVGEETVILDLASGTYFGLNPVGARMWQSMVAGKTLAAVCDAIEAEYQATRPEIEKDLEKLVDELASRGLISVSNATESGPST